MTERVTGRRLPELEAVAFRVDRPPKAADAVQQLDPPVDLDAARTSRARKKTPPMTAVTG